MKLNVKCILKLFFKREIYKINHLLRSGKRRRDTRDYDIIPPILGEDA